LEKNERVEKTEWFRRVARGTNVKVGGVPKRRIFPQPMIGGVWGKKKRGGGCRVGGL